MIHGRIASLTLAGFFSIEIVFIYGSMFFFWDVFVSRRHLQPTTFFVIHMESEQEGVTDPGKTRAGVWNTLLAPTIFQIGFKISSRTNLKAYQIVCPIWKMSAFLRSVLFKILRLKFRVEKVWKVEILISL